MNTHDKPSATTVAPQGRSVLRSPFSEGVAARRSRSRRPSPSVPGFAPTPSPRSLTPPKPR